MVLSALFGAHCISSFLRNDTRRRRYLALILAVFPVAITITIFDGTA